MATYLCLNASIEEEFCTCSTVEQKNVLEYSLSLANSHQLALFVSSGTHFIGDYHSSLL